MWDPSHPQVVALKEKIVKYCLRGWEQPVIFEFLWIFQSIALQMGLYARIWSRVQKQAHSCIQDGDLGQFLRSHSILISPTKCLLTPAVLTDFFPSLGAYMARSVFTPQFRTGSQTRGIWVPIESCFECTKLFRGYSALCRRREISPTHLQ